MEIYRHGMFRNYGFRTLLHEQPPDVVVSWEEGSNVVGFYGGTNRLGWGKASYSYGILIEPQLIIRALLELPSDKIAGALDGKDIDPVLLGEKITALVQGLAKMKTAPAEAEAK